jgi:hypothetical protein
MSCKDNLETFIKKANEVHSNKYDYSKSIYNKSNEKIIIICNIHGEFYQTPSNHIQNHGCKKCAIDIRKQKQTNTQEEFIKRVNERWPNLLDLSKTIYVNFKSKIIVKCKKCDTEYKTDATQLLCGSGYGCKICNGGGKHNKEIFIKKANEVHNYNYNYDLVEYKNAHTKIIIKCINNHLFEQTPNKHLMGQGCPKCKGRNKTPSEFIELSREKFGNIFNYSKMEYKDMYSEIILICNNNHTFVTTPTKHLNNTSKGRCKECQYINNANLASYTQNEWIITASKVHSNYYNYSNVKYINSSLEIDIICPQHGLFKQKPVTHLSGSGCKLCSNIRVSQSKLLTEDDFNMKIQEAKKIHNFKYEYNNIYRYNNLLYIDFICPKHGNITQRLCHHMRGHGCFNCKHKYSKVQIEWLNYQQINRPIIQSCINIGEYKIPNTNYYADGFQKDNNIIYEFHGDFWHGNPDIYNLNDINPITNTTYKVLYDKTLNKIKTLQSLGYIVIEIWENKWRKAKQAIKIIQKYWRIKKRKE